MCRHGDDVLVRVNIPAELSHTGAARWDVKAIDCCVAPIVEALNAHGILTTASCCGHGKGPGSIILQDGRELMIRGGVGVLPASQDGEPGGGA